MTSLGASRSCWWCSFLLRLSKSKIQGILYSGLTQYSRLWEFRETENWEGNDIEEKEGMVIMVLLNFVSKHMPRLDDLIWFCVTLTL